MKLSLRNFSALLSIAFFLSLTSAASAQTTDCKGSNHLLTVKVLSSGTPLTGAQVKIYTDANYHYVADDLARTGIEDAIVNTNSIGEAWMALAPGHYYISVTAANNIEHRSEYLMPNDGECGYEIIDLQSSANYVLDLGKTQVALSPTSIQADNAQSAIVTVRAYSTASTTMAYVPVDLQSTLAGMYIEKSATSTDKTGYASFKIRATVTGSAALMVYLNNTLVRTLVLKVVATGSLVTEPGQVTSSLVSPFLSTVEVFGSPALPDGRTPITLRVTAKDVSSKPLSGQAVVLRSTLLDLGIDPGVAITGVDGSADFKLTYGQVGKSLITAIAGGVPLEQRPIVEFFNPFILPDGGTGGTSGGTAQPGANPVLAAQLCRSTLPPGTLYKMPSDGNPVTQEDSTVWYIGVDCFRHPFPYSKVYFTWYKDYTAVKVVPKTDFLSFAIGSDVTVRPGLGLLKMKNDPRIFVVSRPRQLRWIRSPQAAVDIFGARWDAKIVELPEEFYGDYVQGTSVFSRADYDAAAELDAAPTPDQAF
ncbi:MAG: Ig-like domain-containing protein [Patescibacteria group bacterium]|nr:Ig-like domain-containing protein [Patescibacteria group bacterium]